MEDIPLLSKDLMQKQKHKIITGTFDEKAFQLSLVPRDCSDGDNTEEDHIHIATFDLLGYHITPHCGVYGEEYNPFVPILLLALPFHHQHVGRQFSKNLIRYINTDTTVKTEFYIMIYPQSQKHPCQHFLCDETWEINLVYHCWAYPEEEFNENLEVQEIVNMGIFDVKGVKGAHLDVIEPLFAGVSIDHLSPRIVDIHHQRFSPANAQMLLVEGAPVHSFFSLAKFDTRQVVCYHVFPGNNEVEAEVTNIVYNAQNLLDVVSGLLKANSVALHDVAATLIKILEPLADR